MASLLRAGASYGCRTPRRFPEPGRFDRDLPACVHRHALAALDDGGMDGATPSRTRKPAVRCGFTARAHKFRLLRLIRKAAEPGGLIPGLSEDSKDRFERVKT